MIWLLKLSTTSDGIRSEISYHIIDTIECPIHMGMGLLTQEGIAAISKESGRNPEHIKVYNGTRDRWETVASGDKAIAIKDTLNDLKILKDRLERYGINIRLEVL